MLYSLSSNLCHINSVLLPPFHTISVLYSVYSIIFVLLSLLLSSLGPVNSVFIQSVPYYLCYYFVYPTIFAFFSLFYLIWVISTLFIFHAYHIISSLFYLYHYLCSYTVPSLLPPSSPDPLWPSPHQYAQSCLFILQFPLCLLHVQPFMCQQSHWTLYIFS